ncbi:MAG: MGMT family protein [Clostridia bacterium]|nr:MGMT family protein [Clostridia bacterium]
MTPNFFETVYAVARTIPSGRVMSYGQIAALAGNRRMARQVGWAMHACPPDVPWHRVVRADGSIATGDGDFQRTLLEAEGVEFDGNGRVLRNYFAI